MLLSSISVRIRASKDYTPSGWRPTWHPALSHRPPATPPPDENRSEIAPLAQWLERWSYEP